MALEGSLEVDLLLNDVGHGELNVSWEVVVPSNVTSWSVESQVSEEVVFAGEDHLDELIKAESSVTVVVEEHDKVVSL